MPRVSFPENLHSRAFDELATSYDDLFTVRSAILREAVWTEMAAVFQPQDLVLDIGCGTGEDAAFLARRRIGVLATDISGGMIQQAERKLRDYGNLARCVCCDAQNLPESLPHWLKDWTDDRQGQKCLAGIVSNFGALNCLSSLEPIRIVADRYLIPGGHLVLCLINRFYFREAARGVFRRFHPNGSAVRCGSQMVPLYYHGIAELRWPGYELLKLRALAVFTRSDIWDCWPLNRWGDHYLAVFRKANRLSSASPAEVS